VRKKAIDRMAAMRHGDNLRGEEWVITRADGEERTLLISTSVLYDPDEGVHVLAMMQDITDRKRAEEQSHRHLAELAHVGRLATMGEMATGLAHEVNQPLAAIATYADACCQLIQDANRPDGKRLRVLLDKIHKQSLRAGEIVRRLRGYVRRAAPSRVATDLNKLIRESVEVVFAESRLHNITVEFDLGNSVPDVLVDPIQLQQVVLNLVKNAMEAVAEVETERRCITLATTVRQNALEVSIRDNGPGIPEATKDQVFDAFFTTKPDGMGMGLAISRSIVEAHGGRLSVADLPTRGSVFRFTVPISSGTEPLS
jgi:two-component system sensor kinase FixL